MKRILQRGWGLGILWGVLLAFSIILPSYAEEDFEDNEIYFISEDENYDEDEVVIDDEDGMDVQSSEEDDEADLFFSSYDEEDDDDDADEDYFFYSAEDTEEYEYQDEDDAASAAYGSNMTGVSTDEIPGWPDSPELAADCAYLMENASNLALYAKNADALVDPGSTVKIMTALLALEKSSLTDSVTMTETGVGGVTDGGLSISAQVGEVFTMEQLLYALMLASANDAALQIAEQVGGSLSNFVRMMNEKAVELGCKNTNFTNPTGLEDPHQVSTARDLALIMQAAILEPDFTKIATSRSYMIPATNMSGGDRVLTNSFSLQLDSSLQDVQVLGGKQGYTATSGSTLLWAVKRDNRTLICVLLLGADSTLGQDAQDLMSYGFDDFTLLSLGDEDFDILSGGDVIVPSGTHEETLKSRDTLEGDKMVRTYFFGNVAVGHAVVSPMEEVSDTAERDGAIYLEEARRYSEEKSIIPYFLIIGIGLAALILLARHFYQLYQEGEFSATPPKKKAKGTKK